MLSINAIPSYTAKLYFAALSQRTNDNYSVLTAIVRVFGYRFWWIHIVEVSHTCNRACLIIPEFIFINAKTILEACRRLALSTYREGFIKKTIFIERKWIVRKLTQFFCWISAMIRLRAQCQTRRCCIGIMHRYIERRGRKKRIIFENKPSPSVVWLKRTQKAQPSEFAS